MGDIEDFLKNSFLSQPSRPVEPDGRLLYLYECDDDEFVALTGLLRQRGSPRGHNFNRYRKRWQEFRRGHEGSFAAHRREDFWSEWSDDSHWDHPAWEDLDWTIRGFVLYASEVWRRFGNKEWRERQFPDSLPFDKLTWGHFLYLVGWNDLNRSGYPGLYFPMLAAWEWWRVAPIRLPTSIRYLDTCAHQGGATNSLVIEYELVRATNSKSVYAATKPTDGYGADVLSFKTASFSAGSRRGIAVRYGCIR